MTYTELFTQLVGVEIELWNSLDRQLLTDAGVTLPTFQALSAIEKLEAPARVQDISQVMSITVGATSKVVDRLERAELVERASNPDDRRSSIIVMTEAGKQTLKSAAAAVETHLRSLLSGSYPVARAESLTADLLSLRTHLSGRAL